MPRTAPIPLLGLILSATLASPAFAHEFNLLLLAPADAPAAEIDDMRAAFLLAAHERDSHPDETSEGHLGGLDVQLTLARIDEAAPDTPPDIVAAPFAAAGDAQVAALAAPGSAAIVDAGVLDRLAPADDPALGLFAERFLAGTGRVAGPAARAAYRAARVADMAVRPLGGVDDRAGLNGALAP